MLWVVFWREIPTPNRRRSTLLWPLASMLLAACIALIFATIIPTRIPFYSGVEAVTRSLAVLGWLARLAVSPESRHFFYPVLEDPSLPVMVVLGAVVLLAAAAVSVAVILRKRLSLEGFTIVAFLLLCTPSVQLIPYQPPSLVSDRWLALAVWPVILLIVALAWRLKPVPRTALLLVLALSWSFQTLERPRDWRSLEALLDADIRAYPGFYLPAEHKIIDVQLKKGLHREAIETASSISDPVSRDIMIELIKADYVVKVSTAATGNPQEAMTLLWKLELDLNPPIQTNWNTTLKNFWGKVAVALVNEWEYLAKQFPDAAPVRYNAGLWLLKVHKYKEAIVHLRAAAESQRLPESARGTALKNLGLALIGSGDVAAAEVPLRSALEQSPPDFRAYCSLSEVYKRTGRLEEAARAEAGCRSRAPGEGIAK
jgi:tetratricopeptide (TPR) repeat protein